MAKRPRAVETSQDEPRGEPPTKKIGPAAEHRDSWQYPPEFWNRLSKISLERDALEELGRRTSTRPSFPPPPTGFVRDIASTTAGELVRFARRGGPDLGDLRGYPAPSNHRPTGAMSSSLRSRATKSTDPTNIETSSGTTKTKKSRTPYNRNFEQHLTDHNIYPTYKSRKPDDLKDVRAALAIPRLSLSSSKFSDGAFDTFQESDTTAKDEADVIVHVVPLIAGPRQTDHPSAMNTPFKNLEPLTDDTIPPAKPDIYYGAYPEQLNRPIRDELGSHIIPSTMEDKPMAPNFFLEVKGPDGASSVAKRQARYDGAIGARGMHRLQNYSRNETVYDGNPYTFSSTYHDGHLQIYTHHPTAPTISGGRPDYHMTQVNAFAMTNDRENFVKGATAFRNARDLAKSYRDGFIQAANVRVAQLDAQSSSGPGGMDAAYFPCEEESASWEDGVDYSTSHGVGRENPEAAEWRVDDASAAIKHLDASYWYGDDELAASQHTPDHTHDNQTNRQDEYDMRHNAVATQLASSKRRRDSESPGSRGSRQKPSMTWEYGRRYQMSSLTALGRMKPAEFGPYSPRSCYCPTAAQQRFFDHQNVHVLAVVFAVFAVVLAVIFHHV